MAPDSVRHFPLVGGLAAWHVPVVMTPLALGAIGLELPEMAVALVGLGLALHGLVRGGIVEISPRGVTRGFVLNGRFVGRTTVIAWGAVASVHTDWRRPGDDTALQTTVRDDHGHAIHFTTAMGLHAYWTCLAAVAESLPETRRLGLTDAALAGRPLGRRTALPAAATAGALALIIVALAGVHYLWAQGSSSLARSIEPAETAAPPADPIWPR